MRNLFITFKLMWATAKAWGYTEKNICDGIVLPKMTRPDRPWFTEEEMRKIISKLMSHTSPCSGFALRLAFVEVSCVA